MRLRNFVSADPRTMAPGTWRQELVAGAVVPVPERPEAVVDRGLCVLSTLTQCVRRAKKDFKVVSGSGIGVESPEGDNYRVADVIVSVPARPRGRQETLLIAHVLGSLDDDPEEVARRVAVYRGDRTVKEILLFAADRAVCDIHRRVGGGGWSEDRFEGLDATIRLLSVKTPLMLLSVYSDLES